MQLLNFKSRSWQLLGLLMMGAVIFTGCKDDDDDDDPTGGVTPVEDGFYVTGSASAFGSPSINGTFSVARNEIRNGEYNSGEIAENNQANFKEGFFALTSSGTLSIKQVSGTSETTWGFGSDLEVVAAGSENDGPQVDFQRGSLVSGGTAISVPNDGLYHISFDTDVNKLVVVPIEYWGLIGAATPGGWSSDTQLALQSFSTSGMTFEATDVMMTVSDWKFRYSGGWKVVLDTTFINGGALDNGIKLNTNYGTAVDNLTAGGDNMTNQEAGFYTATMTWAPGAGFSATMVKTSDLPLVDYTSTELGLVGAGLNFNGAPHNWDETIHIMTPAVAGTVYTWTMDDVEVNVAGGGFKIREGQTWDDLSFGYTAVDVTGSAASDFETNGDGNFIPLIDGGMYNMTFVIDASTDTKTFTIEPA